MSQPSWEDFINACSAVATYGPIGAFSGYSLIDSQTISFDGFQAAAFRNNATGAVIVAFEASILDLADESIYAIASRLDDALIFNGSAPQRLFNDAIAFTSRVQAEVGLNPIFVTGHSMGGAEAEAAIAASGSTAVGGMTFGAPGLPGSGLSSNLFSMNLVNYVDYGDWVGNYAKDSSSELNKKAKVGPHIGSVVSVGTPSEGVNLVAANNDTDSVYTDLISYSVRIAAQLSVDHTLLNYDIDLSSLFGAGTIPIENAQSGGASQTASQLANIIVASANPLSPPTTTHPVVTGPSTAFTYTNTTTPLSTWFSASETPSGSVHRIDHYTAFIVSGTGSILVGSQSFSLGHAATNVTPAQFATAIFNAGSTPGGNQIAVVAFDDLGNSSVAAETTVTVTTPPASAQPIIVTDHTPPTIVATGQQLVTGVGSNPTLSSSYLQVADSNSAHYTPEQLTYTITSNPSHGYLIKGGSIVTSFSQADINNNLIEYQENGTIASSESFSYYVTDPAGNRSATTSFTISINAPPTSTHPSLMTNAGLSVGQGQTALITDSNLFVTDTGLNPWQIIYTVSGGPAHGQILADGINPVSWFTQQQVDLGLISYQNIGNVSGTDNFNFTVSDSAGSTLGQTTFGINVIPQNNLAVSVERQSWLRKFGQ
ncbi:cadherin-like domain-containing protein [Bradyrhizobium sp. 2S1]|uniref:cadherin-like domain-containing protein n=1 Tax=Bradyrhizobium sp. 2S1 TaxID=1404429 RepID=UPI00140B9CD9|nr:cadherin-like domain-containing protein [Bradyrhizobium sp. 2S1]MCK7664553.1 hypothetical protein [Bradyrhizobium sp. 2S1]